MPSASLPIVLINTARNLTAQDGAAEHRPGE
jgi:hypothetical protein